MLINNYATFRQLNMSIYMFSLSVKEILNHYKVDTYEENTSPNGYQRPPIPSHYKNIASYLIESADSIFLPSAILGAIDCEDIYDHGNNSLEIQQKIRIVDGQHRLKGFETAIEKLKHTEDETKLNTLLNFELPIILMVIDQSKRERINEISAFIDINMKGKKVSADLAITLRDKMYDQTDKYFLEADKRQEKIATNTAKYLTKKATFSVWYSAIKMTPSDKGTIISVNSFNKSLSLLIDLIDKELIKIVGNENLIEEQWVKKIIEFLPLFISDIWDIIHSKWPGCFDINRKFNKNYNIQKGIGVHSLHLILADCLHEIIEYTESKTTSIQDIIDILTKTKNLFEKVLLNSPSTQEDWLSGKKFSGYNSASGFKKVKNYILKGTFDN
ncbi:DGQHR domain-containing protein [Bacillus toyonensis]|uniref:DGQHR domain-containing protein n=1 Tax=Bacillus toyonensis TaxID=155322 RepID=UPI001CD72AB3|nr:DGQHR domain-containing protein [Bacillus toyonensis]MCA1047049.1 DGQHR domain-containing protein [Bacillus toyonensis]